LVLLWLARSVLLSLKLQTFPGILTTLVRLSLQSSCMESRTVAKRLCRIMLILLSSFLSGFAKMRARSAYKEQRVTSCLEGIRGDYGSVKQNFLSHKLGTTAVIDHEITI
jgi:hypothetical protein